MATNAFLNRLNNYENAGKPFSFSEWLSAIWDGKYALMIPFIILGGIYSGIFTPTEAASVAVVTTLSIGMILKIDSNRYTGFDVNTSTNETRILMGWKWSMLGISVKEVTLPDNTIDNVNMYSFGVKYGILDNMNAIIEYVLSGDTNTDDFLRLTVGVQF